MSVVVECRTVLTGLGCKLKVVAADEDEALRRIEEHTRSAHSVEPTAQLLHAARSMMRDAERRSG